MDVVVDFLLEYYVWILVVLVILLITVIGFLADTKRKKKKRESMDKEQNVVNQNVNGFDPNINNGMLNQNMNGFDMNAGMNMGVNNFDNNMMNNFNNNMNGNVPVQNINNFDSNMNMGMNNFNNNVNDFSSNVNNMNSGMLNQNVNNGMSNGGNDAFFASTSDQTPVFEPRNIEIPKPVESTPIMNMGSTPSPVVEPIPVMEPNMNFGTMPNNGQVSNMNLNEQTVSEVPSVSATQVFGQNVNPVTDVNVNQNSTPVVETVSNVVPTSVLEPSVNVVPNMGNSVINDGTSMGTPVVQDVNPVLTANMNLGGQFVNEVPSVNATPVFGQNVNPVTDVNVNQNSTPVVEAVSNVVHAPAFEPSVNVVPNMNMATPVINEGVSMETSVVQDVNPMSNANTNVGVTNVNTMPNMMNGTTPVFGPVPTPNNQMPTGSDNWQL